MHDIPLYERVIWSADVQGVGEVMANVERMSRLKVVKIDRLFTERNGKGILDILRDAALNVFYDAKFIEIPSKLEELAREAMSYRPWMVNCMAGSISNGYMSIHKERDLMDGLRRFSDVCLSAGSKPCGVTVLTSKTDDITMAEFNMTARDQVLWYVEMLIAAQFTDVVCSPVEVQAIREAFGDAIDTDTPGVRFSGTNAGDQARVMTPGRAIEQRSTRLVMGRPLTEGDPAANFERAISEVKAALPA